MRFQQNEAIDWDEIELDGPDVESRETLLLLAKMMNDAYLEPGEAGWYELGGEWNVVSPPVFSCGTKGGGACVLRHPCALRLLHLIGSVY